MLVFVLLLDGEEFFFFLDDPSLESADDVDSPYNDRYDEQYDLYSLEVTDQLLNAGRECKAEAGKHTNPNRAACQRQQRKPQEAEVSKPVEYRARGSKPIHVFNDEYGQHSEPAHKL